MKPSPPIARLSLADQIKEILLERILDGTYAPGHRLLELAIAREFQTSQGPVREALRELEAMQLLQTEPYKGARVREVGEEEMREAYHVRATLEQFAAELAAPKLKGNTSALQKHADGVRDGARAGDKRAYARHDLPFHRMIVEAAENGILLRTWESLGFETRTPRMLARRSLDLMAAQALHQPIVDALARGDGKAAGRLLRRHASFFYPEKSASPARGRTGKRAGTPNSRRAAAV